jgi:hypothetical protein
MRARAGYAVRGLIYTVIGGFSVLAAIGAGKTMGAKDALRVLLSTAAGTGLALLLVTGLALYALWRLVQAVLDTDNHGLDAKGTLIRVGLIASGLTYATLASYALSLSLGTGGGGGGGGGWSETLAAFIGGKWTAALLAIALAAVGVAHLLKAYSEKYAPHLDADEKTMQFLHPLAKTGLTARGLVFLILAFLMVPRSVGSQEDASSKAALDFIQALPFGWLLLTAMGAGLLAFAAYSYGEALYRKVDVKAALPPTDP